MALGLYFSREYPAAIQAAKQTIRSYPDFPNSYRWLAAALGQLGCIEEATEALQKAMAIAPASFQSSVRERVPWMRPEDHVHMLEGLRKAGLRGDMSRTRRLAAILAADVAGYSRLMEADEEGTLERLQALRRELLDPKIAEHHGRIVKTAGDGMLVEFASDVDAVRCAVEVQQAIPERNTSVAANNRIELRIGIDHADVIVEGDDLYGGAVNIAARIEALADAGGVFVSNTVYNRVRDQRPFVFEDLGEQQVKNIPRPVRVYRVRLEGPLPSPPLPGLDPEHSP
jgi:class 3 adenylate cyclase